jgi:hypothetical protein
VQVAVSQNHLRPHKRKVQYVSALLLRGEVTEQASVQSAWSEEGRIDEVRTTAQPEPVSERIAYPPRAVLRSPDRLTW